MAYGDTATFFGFRVNLPVAFEGGPEVTITDLDDGSVLKQIVNRPLIVKFELALTKEQASGDARGSGGVDIVTLLQDLKARTDRAVIPMIQNVRQADTFSNAIAVRTAASKRTSTIAIVAQGSNRITVGRVITFSNHRNIYRVKSSTPTSITIVGSLAEDVPARTTINTNPSLSFHMLNSANLEYPDRAVTKTMRLKEAP